MSQSRETLASRLGFILLSAGCAIGLGNVWRFPYIVGKYGGCIFVLLYLLFLIILGFPLLLTEMTVGRGSHANQIHAFYNLAQNHKRIWWFLGFLGFGGCLILMMYYTNVSGWVLYYTKKYACGGFSSCSSAEDFSRFFGQSITNPWQCILYTAMVCILSGGICALGLKNGVEVVIKYLMLTLLFLMTVLAIRSVFLPGAVQGLKFYLMPNWANFMKEPSKTVFAAMGQAFFTLSIGMGSMEILGSYLNWKNSLCRECFWIILLDTFVAITAGFIIFPICASKGIDMATGPSLVFVSLPNIFAEIPGQRIWGCIFFSFLFMAALSTVVAAFETLIAYFIDAKLMSRPLSALLITLVVILLSIPCILGFSVWRHIQPLGEGSCIMDLEDFIVSQNLMPLGGIIFLLFAFSKSGWGQEHFTAELNTGQTWKFPGWILIYMKWIFPFIILLIFFLGYWKMFFNK